MDGSGQAPRGGVAPAAPGARSSWMPAAALCALLFVFLLWRKIGVTHRGYLYSLWKEWNTSEWMIDYGAGFVRRGLSGEVSRALLELLRLDFFAVLTVLTLPFFVGLCAFLLGRLAAERGMPPWWRLIVLASPLCLFFPLADGSFYRKDVVFLCALALQVLALEGLLAREARWRGRLGAFVAVHLFSLALPLLLLAGIHEGLTLFCYVPAALLLFATGFRRLLPQQSTGSLAAVGALLFGPGLALCVLSVLNPGSPEQAERICRGWIGVVPGLDCVGQTPAAVKAIGETLGKSMSGSWKLLSNGRFLVHVALGLYGLALLHAAFGHVSDARRRLALPLALALLGGALPLFAIGWDWGRWLYLAFGQALVILTSRPLCRLLAAQRWALRAGAFLAHPRGPGPRLFDPLAARMHRHAGWVLLGGLLVSLPVSEPTSASLLRHSPLAQALAALAGLRS